MNVLEKLRGWIGLKEVIILISIICAGYTSYQKVEVHDKQIWLHSNYIQTIEKSDIRTDERLSSLEKKQERTDGQLEKLNDTLYELNMTIVKLSSVIENLNDNKKGS